MAETVHFSFDYVATSFSGSGVLTASTTETAGKYAVTGITGTTNGHAITGLVPTSSTPSGSNDNLFYFGQGSASTYVDQNGISFTTSDGTAYNVFFGAFSSGNTDLPWYHVVSGQGGVTTSSSISFANIALVPDASGTAADIAPVPEPSSLMLVGTGIFGLAAPLKRRFA